MTDNQEESDQLTSEQKRKRMGIRTLPDGRKVQDISFLLDAEEEGLERTGEIIDKETFPETTVNTKHSHPRAISSDHITKTPDKHLLVTNLKTAVIQIEEEKSKARNMTTMKLPSLKK